MSCHRTTELADLPFSAPADRNKAPILAVLESLVPPVARVLEIASGTGQHAVHFAQACPTWDWQPTDTLAPSVANIARRCAGLVNCRVPQVLDVLAQPWPLAPGAFDAIYCANLLHIAPWAVCPALMRGAAQHLVPGGVLVLYGPYIDDTRPTAPGNLAFDTDLRARDPAWGLRNLSLVMREAQAAGLHDGPHHDMPANNRLLVFRRPPAAG